MGIKIGGGIKINRGLPSVGVGSWGSGISARRRKGLAYSSDWLGGAVPGKLNMANYENPYRFLK